MTKLTNPSKVFVVYKPTIIDTIYKTKIIKMK